MYDVSMLPKFQPLTFHGHYLAQFKLVGEIESISQYNPHTITIIPIAINRVLTAFGDPFTFRIRLDPWTLDKVEPCYSYDLPLLMCWDIKYPRLYELLKGTP